MSIDNIFFLYSAHRFVIMDSVNNYTGLITSYHMLDDVVIWRLTPPAGVAFTNTNTRSCVLCITVTSL